MMVAVEGRPTTRHDRRAALRRALIGLLLALAVAVAVASVPFLPANPDLYLHLVWSYQVMRCLAQGAAPVWLPDLNAGFGSPGVRLHNPLGPVVDGVLGVGLGDAGSGLRAAAVLAAALLLALLVRRRGRAGIGEWLILMASPVVAFSLLGRSAWSEFLALPLVWWLLEAVIARALVPWREGPILALLWLLHGPSTVMVVLIVVALTGLAADARLAGRAAGVAGVAAGLTAWHWLPLAGEMAMADTAALTGGIFRADRNVLGSPQAHSLDVTIFLAWCAVALLAAALLGRWWRSGAARLVAIAACTFLASPLAVWLWRAGSPLAFLQFPWRWLLPATVLAVVPMREALRGWWGRVGLAAVLAPLVLFPWPQWVRGPRLTAAMGWQDAGIAVSRAISGNPLLVDAPQHRPASWGLLASNLLRFKREPVLLVPEGGTWSVERWAPLDRVVAVDLPAPARVELRLLDYPTWQVRVDGAPVPAVTTAGVVGAAVPAGRHTVRVTWAGNPLSRLGLVAAGLTFILLLWVRFGSGLRRTP
jgi:hypothetical protein